MTAVYRRRCEIGIVIDATKVATRLMSDTRPVDDEDAAVAYTDPSQSAHKPAAGGHGGGGQGGAGGSAAQ